MRTTTFFAFFLAMFAMVCSYVSAEAALEKRAPVSVATTKSESAFDATVSLLVKTHAEITAKAFVDVCTDAEIEAALATDLSVKLKIGKLASVKLTSAMRTKVNAKVKASVKATIQAEIEAVLKAEFNAKLEAEIKNIITKKCDKKDAACIKTNVKFIVKESIKVCGKLSLSASKKLRANLDTKIKVAVEAAIKELEVKILFISLEVQGGASVSTTICTKFKAVVDLCAKAYLGVEVKLNSQIKTICNKSK
ncbi:hypothetical protein B0O80DRAFT_451654 [Mortierella sp. GBAus27b]|nr:hypothetical protein BGX31_008928 [Mortierella sp. GBA43]KAI8353856.1 hypothetical protein B0O80DRAFT_451654 [Mortierella sp. GBAus27b]